MPQIRLSHEMKNLWKSDVNLKGISVENIRVVYIDLDVILLKTYVNPLELYIEVGRRAIQRGTVRRGVTAVDFQHMRATCLNKTRKNLNHQAISLQDIYNEMPINIGNIQDLVDLELKTEINYRYCNPSVLSFLLYLSEKNQLFISIVSNAYYSSDDIKFLLKSCGFPMKLLNEVVISQKGIAGKYSELVKKHEKLDEVLFLSNERNEISLNPYTLENKRLLDIFELEKIRHGILLPELHSLRKLATNLASNYSNEDALWFTLGAGVLGPFFSLFADWVVEICSEEKKTAIYPFMREGNLFARLLKNTIKNEGLDIKVKELYVSRLSTYFASIKEFDMEQIEYFFDLRSVTVRDLFQNLGLSDDVIHFDEYLDVHLKESKNTFVDQDTTLSNKLIRFLLSENIQNKIKDTIEHKRKILIDYLTQEMQSFYNIVTVDLGFKGTIQKFIESALQFIGIPNQMTHLLGMGGQGIVGHLISGMDIRGFVGSSGENIDLIRDVIRSHAVIEQLMFLDEGSTLSYEKDNNGKVYPLLDTLKIDESELRYKTIVQEGILQFQRIWLDFKKQKKDIASQILNKRRELLQIVHRLIDIPTYEEAKMIGALSQEDNFGSSLTSKICDEEKFILIEQEGIEPFYYKSMSSYFYGNVYWPQGLITLFDPLYLYEYHSHKNDDNRHLTLLIKMVSRLRKDGVKKIIIYGAGEAGQELLKIAVQNQLVIECIVDRKQSLWGSSIQGVEVASLDYAIKQGSNTFAIGSFAFAEDIKREILDKYQHVNQKPIIITPFE